MADDPTPTTTESTASPVVSVPPSRDDILCTKAEDASQDRAAPLSNALTHDSAESVVATNADRTSSVSSDLVDDVRMAGKSKSRQNSGLVKSVRYEEAADAPAPKVVGKIDKPSEALLNNARDDSVSLRSSNGNKIANLRAAFENGSSPERSSSSLSSMRKRFGGGDKGNGGSVKSSGRLGEAREDLEKERELRQKYEQNSGVLEEETEKLRHVYDQKCTFLVEEAEQQRVNYEERYAQLAESTEMQRRSLEEKVAALERQAAEQQVAWEQEFASVRRERDGLHMQLLQQTPPPEDLEIGQAVTGDEVTWLRRQLADLKKTISTSTRMDGQVTDSVFAQETGVLHHELQNWIVNNFRRARGDVTAQEMCDKLSNIELTPGQRHQLRPMYAAYQPAAKLSMYQATAISLLMDIFEDNSLYGLAEDVAWRQKLCEAGNGLENVLSPVAHNKWRAVTLDVIRQSEGMEDVISTAAKKVAEKICHALTILSEVEGTVTRLAVLTSIVTRAIELQHIFRVQKAGYQFDLPSTNDIFHLDVMEDIAVEADSPGEHMVRIVKCATFPSVLKVGDEYGDNVHLTNVIFRAKVFCG
ncbi:hypothetical protein LTR78_009784 [Recurvomyces mirabilis]|uniref:Uncharacterized protein n=1 Tax=Recurvomyces mirabilis TaxID=574656 RepID=A0AAE0WIC5_9PEZI|nr:hypothetical protein LTR78_009784 [Recurvomyces mirabilis]KAK5158201.1 hypothetical protein LTS14_003219 [Recurvomyces mirabilis]